MNYKYKIVTLGCPVNQYEGAALEEALLKTGMKPAKKKADIYVINSCAVTQSAARKSRKAARYARKENPGALIVLAGCYCQIEPEEIENLVPEANIIIGTVGRAELPQIILEHLKNSSKKRVLVQKHVRGEKFEEMGPLSSYPRQRPVVKIQEGCNEFCTYCSVIHARGKPRSRNMERVENEVVRLAEAGYREIILAGTHLGIYGTDLENASLPSLLDRLGSLNYPFRIRLSSLEPMGVTRGLLKSMAANRRICRHLYLPLQSGSNRILQKMGRKYTVEEFLAIVKKARELMPGLSVTTDTIVGFPGEMEQDHLQSMETIRSLKISKLHVFPYSPRKGTPAADYRCQVRPDIKKRRVKEMKSLAKELSLNYHREFLGHRLDILVEKIHPSRDFAVGEGFSDNYIFSRFTLTPGIRIQAGEIVSIIPRKASEWGVEGVIAR